MGIAGMAVRAAVHSAEKAARDARLAQGADAYLPPHMKGSAAVAVPERGTVATTATPAQPIDGARLLNVAAGWMGQHVHMSPAALRTAVLYVAAQHFRLAESGRLAWPRFGRMLYVASEPGSGKTTVMLLMGFMSAPWFRGIDANPTAPGICASVKEERAALYIDEFHRLLGAKGVRKADVVTILNVGYEKNGTYLNAKGGKANRESVYAAAVMAGKDTLLTSASEELADLWDRCTAIVHMSRPPADVELAEVTDETEAQGGLIAAKMAAWAAQEMADEDRFKDAYRAACDQAREIGLTGRAKDVWVPLLAAAWLADTRHAMETGMEEPEWKVLEAACEAALEFRKNRPVQAERDPLADLEAQLEAGGKLTAWG